MIRHFIAPFRNIPYCDKKVKSKNQTASNLFILITTQALQKCPSPGYINFVTNLFYSINLEYNTGSLVFLTLVLKQKQIGISTANAGEPQIYGGSLIFNGSCQQDF